MDVVDSWQWLPGGTELLWVSERDGWRHAWAIPRQPGTARLLTPGDFDILSVEGVDEKAGYLYFIASPDDATAATSTARASTARARAERVTPANQPGTHAYKISPDARFAIHTYSTADRPPVIDLVQLCPATRASAMLEDNAALAAAVAPMMAPPIEFFQVDIGDGVKLDGWMMKPKSFDPAKKYPLLMYVYGEPAGAEVDGRVAGRPGPLPPRARRRRIRRRLRGQPRHAGAQGTRRGARSSTARWACSPRRSRPPRCASCSRRGRTSIRERVASWGWSGGGSMTLNLLFRSPDLYKVGMSVAPVPDQTLYDTIYQERYMGLPKDNAEGYKNGSPITFAEGLKGKLLLVHGSGDDNVHFQGSERLVNRMIALNKPFTFMDYPNRTHAINEGEGTSLHLHTLLARYLMENLPPGPGRGGEVVRSPVP